MGFPWRPVPENWVNLPGIGEPLTAGDPLLSQTGQLPHPLSQTSLRKAQWFDLCPMTNPFFKDMVEVMKEIAPRCATWDIVGDPSKIRPYSSFTGLLLSLFSLTAFSFRKPKNKRKAE